MLPESDQHFRQVGAWCLVVRGEMSWMPRLSTRSSRMHQRSLMSVEIPLGILPSHAPGL